MLAVDSGAGKPATSLRRIGAAGSALWTLRSVFPITSTSAIVTMGERLLSDICFELWEAQGATRV
jgi:hypothetical protein